MITVDMTKAREIKKDMIREEREPLFVKLDADFMKALESSDTAEQTNIATKKQALRDATDDPAIAAATTPDELIAVRPAILDNV